jgi:DNA-binding response OmpR family regulator
MRRIVVIEEREASRASCVLGSGGISVEVVPGSADVLLKHLKGDAAGLVLFETATVTRALLRTCVVLVDAVAVPIAVFTERASEGDVVGAYQVGASAVIVEPVGSHELVARVRALLRRNPERVPTIATDVLSVGGIVLDRARREVTVNGRSILLPRKEFDIAEFLMRKAGTVVSRDQLVRELWGSLRDTKTLDVQVGRLRARLGAAEGIQRILTVRGIGYRLVADDEFVGATSEPGRTAKG